jgi:hypothetical protein
LKDNIEYYSYSKQNADGLTCAPQQFSSLPGCEKQTEQIRRVSHPGISHASAQSQKDCDQWL